MNRKKQLSSNPETSSTSAFASQIGTKLWVMSLMLVALFGCVPEPDEIIEIDGLAPVYILKSELVIESAPPRDFGELGKIVVIDSILLINEKYEGIHVVDNSRPGNPKNIAFWHISGNVDFTVTGDLLYADNSLDLYSIDISDIYNIKLITTTENIYQTPQSEQYYPPNYAGYFECVDANKGIVIDWIDKFLIDPRCEATP